MRMFLVGMCDIFLILYLTTLGQVDRNKVSDLTVQDYLQLKEQAAKAQGAIDSQKTVIASLHKDLKSQEITEREDLQKLDSLKADLQAREQALKKAQAGKKSAEENFRTLEEKRLALEQSKKKSAEELRTLQGEFNSLEASLKESEQESSKLEELLGQLRESETQAQEEAEQAKAEAESARRAQEEAKRLAAEAREKSEQAKVSEQIAKIRAQDATRTAIEAKIEALKANEEASYAKQQKEKTSRELKAVIRPTQKTYSTQVRAALKTVRIETRTDALIGKSRETLTYRLVTARRGRELIVVIPFSQAGFQDRSDSDDFEKYMLTVAGSMATRAYLSPKKVGLIAFAVPGSTKGALALQPISAAEKMTPTLFAIRNGSRMKFSDRMRNLDEDYFVFKRDRLKLVSNGVYEYDTEGYRGTRDFAERIVPGDQIVDFRGNLVAVATGINKLQMLDGIRDWTPVDLTAGKTSATVESIWSAVE